MSEDSPRYALSWKDHNDQFMGLLNEFLEENFLTDVELVCQDNKRLSCHKLVLATFSEFFFKVFEQSCEKTFAMVNIKYDDLKVLIDFLYKGDVWVTKRDLPNILTLADFLQIKNFRKSIPKHILDSCYEGETTTTEDESDSHDNTDYV